MFLSGNICAKIVDIALFDDLLLGDIAGKRFRLLRSTLPFRGLSDVFVHCIQKAKDIDMISFAYDSHKTLLDRVQIWLT